MYLANPELVIPGGAVAMTGVAAEGRGNGTKRSSCRFENRLHLRVVGTAV